nr:transmembrane protein, putative [Tanacetum cinerariifolium]
MDLKSCITTFFILFLLLVVPGSSKEGPGSEIYEIDYRGPETHPQRPPPNRYGNVPHHKNRKMHPRSKRLATRNVIKKEKKA